MRKFWASLFLFLFLTTSASASISVQTNTIFGSGNGATKIFSFPFKIFKNTDLQVYEISPAGVVTGPMTLTTDYTVAINNSSEGGTVTFTTAPLSGYQTFIKRIEPFTQSLTLATEGPLPAKQIENQLDLTMMTNIQMNEAIARCAQFPVTSTASNIYLPNPVASQYIGWDSTGTYLVNLPSSAVGTPGQTGPAGPTGATGPAGPAGTGKDTISRGFEIVPGTTTLVVNPGTLCHNTTTITKTVATTLTILTASDWYDGSTHTYGGGAGWCYIGSDSSGNIKLLGANPPNKADTSGNTAGTLYYSYITTTYWRVIGAVHISTGDVVDMPYFQSGEKITFYDVYSNTTVRVLAAQTSATFADVDCSGVIPKISSLAAFLFYQNPVGYYTIRTKGSSATNGYLIPVDQDQYGVLENIPVDLNQFIQYKDGTGALSIWVKGYTLNIR